MQLGFVIDTHHKEAKRRLKVTTAGRKWLAQSPAARLREILFECQRLWKCEDWEDEDDSRESFFDDPNDEDAVEDLVDTDSPLFAASGSGPSASKADLLQWQKSVWRQAPEENCVSLDAFLDYHARASIPSPEAAGGPNARRNQEDELSKEELQRARLESFFWRALVPFGCVEATGHGPRDLRFRLSSAGQYLVGLARSVQYGPEHVNAAVVVQPNFEIVFLGPDLAAEVALAPFAERCGRNAGTLFRLTRPKMILAASRGVTVEGVLSTLARYSSKPVPENVVAEVKAWFASCRSLTVRCSILLQAPDAVTALRIKQLLGPECGQLSVTLLEWPEAALPSKLASKLREQGLFLIESSPSTDA